MKKSLKKYTPFLRLILGTKRYTFNMKNLKKIKNITSNRVILKAILQENLFENKILDIFGRDFNGIWQ